ncbi:MAG: endonuclease/exonuclease/phosphatase family protein [Planctomycetota bacterium]
MKKSSLVLLIAISAGAWFALQQYDLRGLENLQRVRGSSSASGEQGVPPPPEGKETIRIASFNLQSFDREKSQHAAVMDILARVIREFDVIAVQEVRSTRPEVLRTLMEFINQGETDYSILVGPQVDRDSRGETFAYIYNQATIQTDRGAAYVVDDPYGLLERPPLVGWFRVRGPPENQAFTFTLVNIHAEPSGRAGKPARLDAMYRSVFYEVRDDGRGEDDLIMLGVFNADDRHLGKLREIPGLLAAISATPTDTRRKNQSDNLVFQLPATGEYTGCSGVFDFLREYNLTLEEALQVSDHLPVWAEFSAREGGELPAMAGRRGITRRP